MNKQQFLIQLQKELTGLPRNEIEERIIFFEEMIDDRIEEGLAEEDAVSAIGSIDKIVTQIIADTPLSKIAKERVSPKRKLKVWEIVLITLGFPIWFSLGVAAFSVILAVYVSLWAIIISLWSVFASLTGTAFCCFVTGIAIACKGNSISGIALVAVSLICIGLSIFSFCLCKEATKGILLFTKKLTLWIKNCFIKKEKDNDK